MFDKLWRTGIIVMTGVTLPIFGIRLLVFELIVYTLFIFLDWYSWYRAAKKLWKVYSKIEREWFQEKLQIFCLIWASIVVVWWLNETLWIDYWVLWMIPQLFLLWFISAELKSIMENYVVIFNWTKYSRIFIILDFMVQKIFNSSLDKLKEIWEEKIKKKFNK